MSPLEKLTRYEKWANAQIMRAQEEGNFSAENFWWRMRLNFLTAINEITTQ